MNESTRKEIQRITAATLRDAGLTEPPLSVEHLLEHVRLYRDYYDLSDPGFLDRAKYKLQIHGRKLVHVLNKVRLRAVLLFDENRICIDNDLPKIKRPWASCHEAGHRILSWHQPFFYADTAETLDPAYQADLEEEANYAAARLLFLADRFASDARDVEPTVANLKALAKRYGTSLTTTLRRYVEQGPLIAMALLVSTPSWAAQPEDQEHRWRHFVQSTEFERVFPGMSPDTLRRLVDGHARYRRGGTVAEFEFGLLDARSERHELRGWTFNNQYYLLTLVVEERRIAERRIVIDTERVVAHVSRMRGRL
jgi:Zn-dependent peptidase ImmA (M78 family)